MSVRVGVLGPLSLHIDECEVPLPGRLPARLLLVLSASAPRAVGADRILECLWGGSPPSTAAPSLRVHVTRLRRVLEPDRSGDWTTLVTTPGGYALRIGRDDIDAHRYESLVTQAAELAPDDPRIALGFLDAARALWRGQPWGDIADDPWVRTEVERLEELRRRADEQWADLQLELGHHDRIVDELAAAVTQEPLRERRWEQLILARYRCGRQADALRAYQDARRALVDELGIEPGTRLRDLERSVLAQDPRLDAPVPDTSRTVRTNIPQPTTDTVDRQTETCAVRELLGTSRFVTITGPAGCGKSRLATEVARGIVGTSRDGMWLVDLAGTTTPSLVLPQLMSALGMRDSGAHGPSDPGELVGSFLASRELLIVFDNAERVGGEVARLAGTYLSSCPGLRVLVTSRVALDAPGERVLPIEPLALPPVGASTEDAADSPAVRLFLERADDVNPTGLHRGEHLAAVVELCRSLDGLPLAIELAARSVRALSVPDVTRRLRPRLDGLAADGRDDPADDADDAHDRVADALRAGLDWSHALLGADEQLVYRRLSVFGGEFTLAGAEAVCVDDLGASERVIGTIDRLVASSLVRPDHRGPVTRYRMLRVVVDDASVRLATDPCERESALARQYEHYLEVASHVRSDGLFGAPVVANLVALDAEREGIRRTLERLVVECNGERAAALAGALGTYWFERGDCAEGRRWIERALALVPDSDSAARARALVALVETSSEFEAIAARVDDLDAAVALYRTHDDRDGLLYSLAFLAVALGVSDEAPRGSVAIQEVVGLLGEAPNPWFGAMMVMFANLWRAMTGDFAGGHAGLVADSETFLEMGDETFAARTLLYAGATSRLAGESEQARRELARSVRLATRGGNWGTRAHAQLAIAQVAAETGDVDATKLLAECLESLERLGDTRCIAVCRRTLGSLALDAGHLDDALDLLRDGVEVLAATDERALAVTVADLARILELRGDHECAARLASCAPSLACGRGQPLAPSELGRITKAVADFGVVDTPPALVTLDGGVDLDAIVSLAAGLPAST